MSPRTRSRILRLGVVLVLVVVVRELSIRRHENDLHNWPSHDDDTVSSPATPH